MYCSINKKYIYIHSIYLYILCIAYRVISVKLLYNGRHRRVKTRGTKWHSWLLAQGVSPLSSHSLRVDFQRPVLQPKNGLVVLRTFFSYFPSLESGMRFWKDFRQDLIDVFWKALLFSTLILIDDLWLFAWTLLFGAFHPLHLHNSGCQLNADDPKQFFQKAPERFC